MSTGLQKRLAAVVAADVVGYSRLIREDEDGTITALKNRRARIIEPLLADHEGRIANTAGDSYLIEFPAATRAVRWSVAVQAALRRANANTPEDRQINLRIGVNVGDVYPDGRDLLGDGVNIAARLEALAPAGGICLSATTFEQVRDRLDLPFEDLGEVDVKNIDRPIHVFWYADPELPETARPAVSRRTPENRFPVVAVFPFKCPGEHAYFGEGIAEDIITELARFPDLRVIARNSSFAVVDSAKPTENIAADLGAGYFVDGSVRVAGQRVRVTAYLFDGTNGQQLWTERYDRDLTDLFDVQDQITRAVVANVPSRIDDALLRSVKRKAPGDMSAYDLVLKGKYHHHRCTPEDNAEALRLLDAAIECDPEYAPAYAWKSCTLGQALGMGHGDFETLLSQNLESAQTGLSLDANDFECNRILAEFGMAYGNWDEAESHHAQAFLLNPNDPRIVAQRGELMTRTGRPEEGRKWLETANEVDPLGAQSRAHLLARTFIVEGDYPGALSAYHRLHKPRADHLAEMAACYASMGQLEDAANFRSATLKANADFSIANYQRMQKYRDPEDLMRICDAMEKAGLPRD